MYLDSQGVEESDSAAVTELALHFFIFRAETLCGAVCPQNGEVRFCISADQKLRGAPKARASTLAPGFIITVGPASFTILLPLGTSVDRVVVLARYYLILSIVPSSKKSSGQSLYTIIPSS
jgi:hypothetical protein